MPTLKELCEQNELPFKVRREDWSKLSVFTIIDFSDYSAIGFTDEGLGASWLLGEERFDWHLYTEPKPKKKYTPYLISRGGSNILEIQYYSEDANLVPDRRHPTLPDIEIEAE